jgi:tetratricopeptide (TPR) repeat protein
MKPISLVLIFLFTATAAFSQVDEARQAIERGEYVRAVNMLSDMLGSRPTADAYLYLGIAYRHMKEYQKAEDLFREGDRRYADDPRFHIELSNLFLENNDLDAARSELRRALAVDPDNAFASDQLATIDMSSGEVQSALRAWNKSDRPFVTDILHNYYLSFGSRVVRNAVAFHPSGTLRYSEWKTTELRLLETENFANIGLEVEPTTVPDQYNAVVRTTSKTNSLPDFAFNLIKGIPVQTSYLNLWNIRNSGVNFNGNYRWDANRRRAQGRLKIPLPVAGLFHLELENTWRSERWDVSRTIRAELLPLSHFDYKANSMSIGVTHIPHYRVELGAGFEYRNRAAKGEISQLALDSRNTGKFTADASFRIYDGAYQNRLRVEGFAARHSIIGNTQFTGGLAELRNRYTLSKDTRMYFDWGLKGGTARGGLPIDDYFVLGVGTRASNLLRGHTAANRGKYGYGPMGTDFVLFNSDIERHMKTIPLFNNLNVPFLTVKWEVFFDAAKTWDRQHIFPTSKLLLDTGAGLRFETPTGSFNLVYGKSLRDGKNVLWGYYERRLW